MTEPILFDRKGAIAFLTLNRPDAGNAIDVPLARSLLDATRSAQSDPTVRGVVVPGEGRMFCAGGDVKQLHAAGDALPALLREILGYLHPAIDRLARMDKPVRPKAGPGSRPSSIGGSRVLRPIHRASTE